MTEIEGDLDSLDTEGRLAAARDLDLLSVEQQVDLVIRENEVALAAVSEARAAIADVVDMITESLGRGGRLLYFGAGTPGRLGVLDAAEVYPTFSMSDRVLGVIAGGGDALSTSAEANEDDMSLGRDDVAGLDVGPNDVVVTISASGRTPYCRAVIAAAGAAGALTVAVVNNRSSPLAEIAEKAIELNTGPEVVSGSTRMKAGTAQKVVLNILSTLPMVRLGHTMGDLMVGLRVSNEKLARRAQRILVEATGVTPDEAAQTLKSAHNDVKVAVVMLLRSLSPDEARERLQSVDGHVGKAIAP